MAKNTKAAPMPTDNESTPATPKRPRAPRGPSLRWDSDKDRALVAATRYNGRTATPAEAAEVLQAHPAFADEVAAITPFKLAQRVRALRKSGVAISLGRPRYTPDAAALNELLEQ